MQKGLPIARIDCGEEPWLRVKHVADDNPLDASAGYELKGERVKRLKAKCNGRDSDREARECTEKGPRG